MTALRITGFAGEVPRGLPRLLQGNYAQIASHTGLKDGGLTPTRNNVGVAGAPAGTKSIYLASNGGWLTWTSVVDVVPGPVAADRLYITGNGPVPQLWYQGTYYPLALASPATAPVAATSSTVDDSLSYTVLYVFTYVTSFSEESGPSPSSSGILVDGNSTVELTNITPPPATDRGIDTIRIYRSETGSDGATSLFYIATIPSNQTTFTDVIALNPLQEVIPSTNYDPAPDGLLGITALPNGMMIGYVGKQIYFCEPYIPSAWPEIYILTTDYDIMGFGAFGSSIAVMTKGTPYIIQGTAPENMTMEKLEVQLPCINSESIVDMGYTIAYASLDGIVTVDENGARLATKTLMSRDQWQTYRPDTMQCAMYDGHYIASYSYVDATSVTQSGILAIDFSGDQPFMVRSDEAMISPLYDLASGNLYFFHEPENEIFQYDAPSQLYKAAHWRSKKFVLPGPANYSCMLIETVDGPAGFTSGSDSAIPVGAKPSVTIYADGVQKDVVTTTDNVIRLRGGYMATVYEIDIVTEVPITAISLGHSPAEIGGLE